MLDLLIAKMHDAKFMAMMLASVAAVATVLTLAMPLLSPDTLSKRMKSVALEREKIRQRERERLARGEKEKVEILSRARCLILPVRWPEPFGLAFTESMVSGAYVCGTPYGSQPEIVTAETGVLSADADELSEAVRNPQRFKPSACRERVLNGGFTNLDMARKYLEYYEKILTTGSLLDPGESAAATLPDFDAKTLLPWKD